VKSFLTENTLEPGVLNWGVRNIKVGYEMKVSEKGYLEIFSKN